MSFKVDPNLREFVETIELTKRAPDNQRAADIVREYMQAFGIDTVACAYAEVTYDETADNNMHIDQLVFQAYSSSTEKSFASDDYNGNELYNHDQLNFPYFRGNRQPFMLFRDDPDLIEPFNKAKGKEVREFYQGIENFAFSVPVMSPLSEDIPTAGITFRSRMSTREILPKFADARTQAIVLAHILSDRMQPDIRRYKDGINALTNRERECLQFTSTGWRPSQIAHRLSISDSAVRFHLQNARKKLKSSSIGHAVSRAIYYDQISL